MSKIENTGKTPALRISYNVNIEIVDRDKPPHLDNPINRPWKVIGGILYPHAPETTFAYRLKPGDEIVFNDLTITEKQSLSNSDSYLAVYGEFVYWDGFGISHWTHFCAPFTFGSKTQSYYYKACSEYNSADTNK
jgi:hypothetical protein